MGQLKRWDEEIAAAQLESAFVIGAELETRPLRIRTNSLALGDVW